MRHIVRSSLRAIFAGAFMVAPLFLFGTLPGQAATLVNQGATTYDPNTGLQWLDVNTTHNRSVADVTSNFTNPLDPVYGYRYASGAEVAQLIYNAGMTSSLPCSTPAACSPVSNLVNLIQWLGITETFNNNANDPSIINRVFGYTSDVDPSNSNNRGLAFLYYGTLVSTGAISLAFADPQFSFQFPSASVQIGSYLVENVSTTPLPAALPLFASGLGALCLIGWRKKRKKVAAFVQ